MRPAHRPARLLASLSCPAQRAHRLHRSLHQQPGGHEDPSYTVSESEIEHFNKLGPTWWHEAGAFGLLHRMNPVRTEFIRGRLLDVSPDLPPSICVSEDQPQHRFLAQKTVLDVGCGGGIFAEVLARLGGDVLAIDAAEDSIKAARLHAARDPHFCPDPASGQSQCRLAYRHSSVEALLEADGGGHREKYDLVCAMEVLEHVQDPYRFLAALANLTKPGGHIVLSTISRTPLSRLLAITLAESNLPLVGLVPPGTHTHAKFLKPTELAHFFRTQLGWAQSHERAELESRGSVYDPISGRWKLFPRDAFWGEWCNYFFGVRKPL